MSAFVNKLNTKVLTAAFILSVIAMPALADVPVPTLDRVKSEQSAFLDTDYSAYRLTEITADVTAPDGAITINIAGKEYFYTPTDNKDVLQLLSATGSTALIETTQDKALYTTREGKYYTYDSSKLKDSAYTLTEAASADEPNTITLYDKKEIIKYYDPTTGKEVAEADRLPDIEYKEVSTIETTPKYYTVNLNKTQYGDPNGTTTLTYGWEKNADTGNLEFKQDPAAPVGQTITYSYSEDSFTQTIEGKTINESVTDPSGTSSSKPYIIEGGVGLNNPVDNTYIIDNVLYIGNKVTGTLESTTNSNKYAQVSGGAVYNAGELTSVTGLFINNSVEAYSTVSGPYFAYNYAYGGALYNSGAIGDIFANFIGNNVSSIAIFAFAKGGAIYNNEGTIGDITGDFIGNYASEDHGDAFGGAIYNNNGTIGDITGDFIGNYVSANDYTEGGAIYNDEGTIGDITGDFIGNYASSPDRANGGAIRNDHGTIGNMTGNFIGNYVRSDNFSSLGSDVIGGAIYNGGTIENITGDFIGNYASSTDPSGASASGGAIFGGTIGNITGDFIGNYAFSTESSASGGAIDTAGTIGYITGDFIGNYVSSSDGVSGGAIDNSGTICNMTGDFIGNYAYSNNDSAKGGAINNNSATIGNITGDFIGNYAYSEGTSTFYSYAYGGAIRNDGSFRSGKNISNITGNFIGNYARSSTYVANGGAIYNEDGTIGNITGNFIGNYASGSYANGGAIYNNSGTIENITGDFIGNYAQSNSSYALGGAIYNFSKLYYTAAIGLTNNNFLNNYAKSETGTAKGGAIFTYYNLTLNADNGTSLISGNYTESNGVKENNAIYVANLANSSGKIQRNTTLTLNAVNNGKIQIDDTISGGSYYYSSSSPKFWETSGHAYNLALTGDGTGAVSLYNDVENAKVTVQNVTVDLANNETRDYNLVSMTANENTKLDIDIDLNNQTADTITTQNTSTGTITLNLINFIGKYEGTPVTVQILNTQSDALQLALTENIITLPDVDTTVYNDQIISEAGAIELSTTNTTNDSITIKDKIYDTLDVITTKDTAEERNFTFRTTDNYIASKDLGTTTKGTLNINGLGKSTPSTIDANNHTMFDLRNETTLNISNTTIKNAKDFVIKAENANSVVNLTNASFKDTQGTAIQSNVDVNITADGAKSEFSGNTQAIQMNNADKTITMNSVNSGEIVLSDIIDGTQGYSIKLDGDNKSKITLNNNINNANISLDNTNLYLSKENLLDNSQALTLNSGSMYLNNDAIGTMHLPTLNLAGTTNLSVDVDLANETMDRITADTYNITNDATLNVNNLKLLSTTEKDSVKILFADKELANNVAYTGESPTSYKGTNVIYSPIYKYNVNYGVDENDKLGYFFFDRVMSGSGSNGNASDAFNPAVLAPSVATQAGAYTTQLQTFNYAFQHSDTFMNIPYLERTAMINQNKYALSPTGDATDVGTFSPLLTKEDTSGFWVKPYASFENIPLNNGPKVSNINYGTLVGYDSSLTPVAKGWERVLTGYIGYNGASQRYSGVDAYQNGGILGGTATMYKGNFFNATTLSVGATAGDASTMYGNENYAMLLAGIGNKTGYNFEFKDGRIILQPNFLISYTFVNTFDYTNGAGVRIKSDPLNAIQLAPGLKLIGNTKTGWQPYLSVAMVWNLLDDSKVTANDVRLPEMSIDPYVQYGAGIQKRFKDRFIAFGQAMIHNGGRNGVSLTGGIRWSVGK